MSGPTSNAIDYTIVGVPAAIATVYASIVPASVGPTTPAVVITGVICSAILAVVAKVMQDRHEERVLNIHQLRSDAAKVPGLTAENFRLKETVAEFRARIELIYEPVSGRQTTLGRSSRVLLVEDNDDTAFATEKFLTQNRFDVVRASTIAQAIEIYDIGSYDAIVSDLQLPCGDGELVLEHAIKSGNQPRLVVVTATTDETRLARVRKLGAQVFKKPINVDLLLEALRPNGTNHDLPVIKSPPP